jgi:hypothetical protein
MFAARSSGAGSMAASASRASKKSRNKTHSGSQRPQTHMHPLELLLSITFLTILATHMLTDTIKSLRTDAADARRQNAERGASSSTCSNVARRIGFEAHGQAEPTLSVAVITKPLPSQKPESPKYPAVLRRRQMTWLARPGISAHTARAGHPLLIRFSPQRACIFINLTSSAILACCDTHLRPPGPG